MNLDKVYQLAQDMEHSHSGKGISYWSRAAACGRAALLDAEVKEAAEAEPELVQIGAKLDPLKVGIFYHLLQEHASSMPAAIWDATEQAFTPEFKEALRLYRAYQEKYISVRERWGLTDYRTEVALPETEAGKVMALEYFGGELTGRLDGVGRMGDAHAVRVAAAESLPLPGGGIYLFDHKTAARQSSNDVWTYECGLQACAYILLWNLEHPDTPCQGMIFDQITKTKIPQFRSFFVPAFMAEPERIRNLIRIGTRNMAENVCCPVGCKSAWGPCWHFKAGRCGGY